MNANNADARLFPTQPYNARLSVLPGTFAERLMRLPDNPLTMKLRIVYMSSKLLVSKSGIASNSIMKP